MKNQVISAIAACAVLAMPAAAMAADAMGGHDATTAPGAIGAHATMICRPAAAKEHPTAVMMGASKTELVCKTIPAEMMTKSKGGPDLSKALSAEQVDAAWRAWIVTMISVPGNGGG